MNASSNTVHALAQDIEQTLLGLVTKVIDGLDQRGFHMLSGRELRPLWNGYAQPAVRRQRLEQFAIACGAECDWDAGMRRVRFERTPEETAEREIARTHRLRSERS